MALNDVTNSEYAQVWWSNEKTHRENKIMNEEKNLKGLPLKKPISKGLRRTRDSNEFYHSQKEYISSSALKTIYKKSVFHYLNEEFKTSSALTVGTAFHTIVLEADQFDDEFIVQPKFDRRTKAGKEQAKLFEAEMIAQNKMILPRPDYDMIIEMRKQIGNCPTAVDLIKAGEPEVSFYVEDFMGLKVRVRPDSIGEDYIIDLKSCQDASPRAFKRDVWKFSWHVQAAFYMDVLGMDKFYFIASEKKVPFACQVYQLSDEMIYQGRKGYKEAIEQWKKYLETGEAPMYHHPSIVDGIITI